MVRVGIHEHARDGRPLTIESAQNTYVVSDDLPKLCCSLHPTMKLDDWTCETAGGGSVHCASPRVFNDPVLPNLFSTVRRTTMSSPVRVGRCRHGPVHIRPRYTPPNRSGASPCRGPAAGEIPSPPARPVNATADVKMNQSRCWSEICLQRVRITC